MALIECEECGNQISTTAASCPKCGAMAPKIIGPDEEQCPHCMTVVSESATTCPNCRAVKGYLYDSRYGAFGKVGTIVWGVVLPLGIGAVGFESSGVSWLTWAVLLWTAYTVFRLVTGPRWFKSKLAS